MRFFARQILVREPSPQSAVVPDVEIRSNLRTVGTGAQLTRLEPVTEQERQGVEKDRFPGAGFTGQHSETAVELELERLDDRKIADG